MSSEYLLTVIARQREIIDKLLTLIADEATRAAWQEEADKAEM